MREIRMLRATWRGLETWCGSGPPGHNDAPALDPTCGNRRRPTASGDPVGRLATAVPTVTIGSSSLSNEAACQRGGI